jgi:hypothetical protein
MQSRSDLQSLPQEDTITINRENYRGFGLSYW